MRRRFLPAVLLASLALVLAACGSGSSSSSSGGGSVPAGASLVRSDVLAFAAVDSDFGSGQWQQFDKLWQKFPAHDSWLRQLKQSLAKDGLEIDRRIHDALARLAEKESIA